MLTRRERRHIGVRFAAANSLDYRAVYSFLLGNNDRDEAQVLKRLERHFL